MRYGYAPLVAVLLLLVAAAPAASLGANRSPAGAAAVSVAPGSALPWVGPRMTFAMPTPAAASPSAPSTAIATAPLAAASPLLNSSFDALTLSDNSAGVTPPDVIVAAGPSNVVEMVNLVMGIYTKSGAVVSKTQLATFFGTGSDFISDPKVQYDAASGRWFATITDVGFTNGKTFVATGLAYLAVSTSSDPSAAWKVYKVPSTATGECLDQPILGVGGDKVVVSVNVFSSCVTNPTFLGAEWWVLKKADLTSGVTSPTMQAFGPDPLLGSVHPAQAGDNALHMVQTNWTVGTTANAVTLFTLTGLPPSVAVARQDLPIRTVSVPPSAPQQGFGNNLDTGDIRILDASESNGALWFSLTTGCTPAGDTGTRACARVVELNLSTPSVVQDFDVAAKGKYYFFPALRADALEDALIVVAESSSSEFPSLVATGRVYGDSAGAYQPVVTVRAGASAVTVGCTGGVCRYGDYFGASTDPTSPRLLWAAGEFGNGGGWDTRVFSGVIEAILTLGYGVRGGGNGYSSPILSYTQLGIATTSPVSTASSGFGLDPGTTWSVSRSLPGSSSAESWNAPPSPPGVALGGTANASASENLTYYHQFAVSFNAAFLGTGAPAAPLAQYTSFGQALWSALPASVNTDAGTPWSLPSNLSTTATERWQAAGSTAGTVTSAASITVTYYHQYRVTFQYVASGPGLTPPNVAYRTFGANASLVANATVWVDQGGSYAYDAALPGATSVQRWDAGAGATGTIAASTTVTVTYGLQFFVSVVADPAGAQALVTGGGWYDAGATATLGVVSDPGWKFAGWAGGASGSQANVSFTVSGPTTVTASFDPGLTIVAGPGGSVAYSFGSTSGVVPAGSSVTLFVPAGTTVTLTAQPSSPADAFAGWSGTAAGAGASTAVTVNGPMTLTATFGSDLLVVGGIGAVVILVVVLLVLLVWMRRRKRRPAP